MNPSLNEQYKRRMQALQANGYTPTIDDQGRIVVNADPQGRLQGDMEREELFRHVWGPEWPIVRSSRPMEGRHADEQLVFGLR